MSLAATDRRRVLDEPRIQSLVLGLTTFVLAAAVRASSWPNILQPEGVVFRDGDSYSHIWRIWNAASKSVPLSARDPFVNFPDGGEVLWSPAFDWILARAVGMLDLDRSGAEILGAWVPVGLGAMAAALAACLAARAFSWKAGWICGVMIALLPGSFVYTQIGYLDHHAAIAVVGTLLLGGAMSVVSTGEGGPRFWAPIAGLLCSFALLLWAGALLHVAVAQIAILGWALGAESAARARVRTLRLAAAHAVTALCILPFSLRSWDVFGDFSPLALTRFQPIFYGAAALCLLATWTLWRSPPLAATRAKRIGVAAGVGLVGLIIAFATLPELAAVLDRSAGWFTDDISFLANIRELRPLFESQSPTRSPAILLSPLFFVLPLALVGLFVVGWRRQRSDWLVLLLWTSAFGILALSQFRFINSFSIAHSIVWGGALASGLDWMAARPMPRPARVAALSLSGVLLATLLVVVPIVDYYVPQNANVSKAPRESRRRALRDVARWIARERPAPLDASGRPTAALLCGWGAGHDVRYYSGWAVNQDGFGPYVSPENTLRASHYFEATDEDVALEFLEQMGSRLVLADATGAGQPPYAVDSLARRLVDAAGSGAKIVHAGNEESWTPALTRHRLLFARPNRRGGAWLYEIVPGAFVRGRAAPHAQVELTLWLGTPSGHPRVWRDRRPADASGEFRLRVPYATVGAAPSGFEPVGRYRLRTEAGEVEFDVTEAAVQTGSTVDVPSITRPRASTNDENERSRE